MAPKTLEFIAQNKAVYIAEQILWILPNIRPVLVFVALFIALAPVNKSFALIATVLGALPWALILAIPVTSRASLSLVYLSDLVHRHRHSPDRARQANPTRRLGAKEREDGDLLLE
ncbi:hypothetical protein [Salinibacterium sp. ZJ454]|uniref:hypothetical protein n=1 Tax=Salinibacterium sp. ZJ454 TaxID=2708339 RepID=UPI00141D9610|nr:hypothetical protein [Salinibacterium sp. ZJ454]